MKSIQDWSIYFNLNLYNFFVGIILKNKYFHFPEITISLIIFRFRMDSLSASKKVVHPLMIVIYWKRKPRIHAAINVKVRSQFLKFHNIFKGNLITKYFLYMFHKVAFFVAYHMPVVRNGQILKTRVNHTNALAVLLPKQ